MTQKFAVGALKFRRSNTDFDPSWRVDTSRGGMCQVHIGHSEVALSPHRNAVIFGSMTQSDGMTRRDAARDAGKPGMYWPYVPPLVLL